MALEENVKVLMDRFNRQTDPEQIKRRQQLIEEAQKRFESFHVFKLDHEPLGLPSLSKDFLLELKTNIRIYENLDLKTTPPTDVKKKALINRKVNGLVFLAKQYWDLLIIKVKGETYEAICEKEYRLKVLRENYSQQGKFVYYTNQGLREAYNALFYLDEIFSVCEEDVRQNGSASHPEQMLASYRAYIKEQQDVVSHERKMLIRSMVKRLVLASQDVDFRNTDIVEAVGLGINEIMPGELNLDVLKVKNDSLNNAVFNDFLTAIENHGDAEDKKEISQLVWLKGSDEKLSYKKRIASRFGINPDLIPEKPRRPAFLSTGTNFRYEMGNNIYELAKIDVALSHFLPTTQKDIRKVRELNDSVIAEIDKIRLSKEVFGRGFRKYFSGKTLKFIKEMESVLLHKSTELIRHHVNWLVSIKEELKRDIPTLEKQSLIKSLMSSTEKLITKVEGSVSGEVLELFQSVRHSLLPVVSPNQENQEMAPVYLPVFKKPLKSVFEKVEGVLMQYFRSIKAEGFDGAVQEALLIDGLRDDMVEYYKANPSATFTGVTSYETDFTCQSSLEKFPEAHFVVNVSAQLNISLSKLKHMTDPEERQKILLEMEDFVLQQEQIFGLKVKNLPCIGSRFNFNDANGELRWKTNTRMPC